MPFLLVTGHPSCGKSTIVDRLSEYFKERGKDVTVIKDEDNSAFSRSIFNDSQKEKDHRSFIRSFVQKLASKNSIIICDGMNYIKGYRYELFLSGKLSKTTYAVLHCDANETTCIWLDSMKSQSERYGEELIKALIQRYEEPLSKNRWDSPLFEVKIGKCEEHPSADALENMDIDLEHSSPRYVELPSEEIHNWLCEGVPLTENKSTQVVPLAPTNFLHNLDRITQEVVNCLVQGQRENVISQPIVIQCAEEGSNKIDFTKIRSLPELTRLRRQFISMSKSHPVKNPEKIASLFINFLNTTNLS